MGAEAEGSGFWQEKAKSLGYAKAFAFALIAPQHCGAISRLSEDVVLRNGSREGLLCSGYLEKVNTLNAVDRVKGLFLYEKIGQFNGNKVNVVQVENRKFEGDA